MARAGSMPVSGRSRSLVVAGLIAFTLAACSNGVSTFPQPPYRWVKPPPKLAKTNRPPGSIFGTVRLTAKGSFGAYFRSEDGQVSLAFPRNAIVPRHGETAVVVRVNPVDPATLGMPPAGTRYDGNAYTFTATYGNSGAPFQATAPNCLRAALIDPCVVLTIRYPFRARAIDRLDGTSWVATDARLLPEISTAQIVTTRLATFVALQAQQS